VISTVDLSWDLVLPNLLPQPEKIALLQPLHQLLPLSAMPLVNLHSYIADKEISESV
jgi:hypothetical protein